MAVEDMMTWKCDVISKTTETVDFEQVPVKDEIYNGLKCAPYNMNLGMQSREQAQEVDWSNIKLIVPKTATDIKSRMEISVYPNDTAEKVTYLVQWQPIIQKDPLGKVSHIELNLSNKIRYR